MTDLAEFLRARLDKRAAKATAAMNGGEGRWRQVDSIREPGRIEDERGEVIVYDEGSPNEDEAAHIAENDPARVLREVEAARRIVAEYEQQAAKQHENAMEEDRFWVLERIVCLLAAPFSGEPGYKKDWAV